jgi:hypothetical protein
MDLIQDLMLSTTLAMRPIDRLEDLNTPNG